MAEEKKGGYTSVTLGDDLKKKIDKYSKETGEDNRSSTIRRILTKFCALKEKGIDILKKEDKEIKKLVK